MADKKAKKLRLVERRMFKALLLLILVVCLYVKVTYFAGLISFQTRDRTDNPIFRAYGENNWYDTQMFKIWLTIDTDVQTVTVRWEGHAVLAIPPAGFFMVNVAVWTDKGGSLNLYDQDDINLIKSYYGTVVFEHSCMRLKCTNTWCHAEAAWSYVGIEYIVTVTVSCSVYVETSSVVYAET